PTVCDFGEEDIECFHKATRGATDHPSGNDCKSPINFIASRLSYDPDRDVLVHYESPRDLNMKPHGFSGAAVWCQRSRQSGPIWTPCPMMFGVQTRAYMTSKLLQIVDALTIRNFLKE